MENYFAIKKSTGHSDTKIQNEYILWEPSFDWAINYRTKYIHAEDCDRDVKWEDDSNRSNSDRSTCSFTLFADDDDHKVNEIWKNCDDKSLFKKWEISIQNETVIVSRLDGVVSASGRSTTLYKCHLCKNAGRICSSFGRLQRHLATHCRNKCASEEYLDAQRVGEANCGSADVRFRSKRKNDSTITVVPANFS